MIFKFIFLVPFMVGVVFLLRPLILWITEKTTLQLRLRSSSKYRDKDEQEGGWDFEKALGIHDLAFHMSIAGMNFSPYILLFSAFAIGLGIFISFSEIMNSFFNSFILAVVFGSIPFLYLWQRFQKKQQEMAAIMIPTVQTFIGFYTNSDHLANAIYHAAHQMPLEIRKEWNSMVKEINSKTDPKVALLHFAERVGNEWANDFADILIMHLETGADVGESLSRLINEMQNQNYNEEKRLTMLAIYRWGTIFMIFLAIGLCAYNVYLEPKNAYYYFDDPQGKDFVTISIIILFSSFFYALFLGRRKH